MTNSEGNSGWADAMNKILVVKKPKKNKTIILSKGKKLSLMKKQKTDEEENENIQPSAQSIYKKSEIYSKNRVKPNILEKDFERKLQKITVKGVVKLFNAVNKHQSNVKDKPENVGTVLTKKEKVMNSVSKSTFLNYLMGEKKEEIDQSDTEMKMEIDEENEKKTKRSSTWEVLQSNYGIGVKMKDWDNKAEES